MAHAYAQVNGIAALGASALVWGTGGTTNRTYLNDGRMDRQAGPGSVASGTTLTIDMGSAVALSGFALLNHNLYSATSPTVTITAADSSNMLTNPVTIKNTSSLPVSTATTPPPKYRDNIFAGATATKRYWRITFAWTGTFVFVLGEVFGLGTVVTLSRKRIYGSGESEEVKSTSFETDYGEVRSTYVAGPIRSKQLMFSDLTEAVREELAAMWRNSGGGSQPVLWAEEYNASSAAATAAEQECLWGKLGPAYSWVEPDFSLYDPSPLSLRSLGRHVGA